MAESLGALPYELKGDNFIPSAEINREETAGLTHAYLTGLRIKKNSYGLGQIDRTSTENVKSSLLSTSELVNNNFNLSTNLTYKDADKISDFYSLHIFSLANEKILSGYPDGTFKAKESICRAETINILLAAKGENLKIISSQ